ARCTRFADEIAGDPLITFVDRGDRTQVLTFPDDPFSSYFSGNTVQICPVGALLSKQYRFKARPWDLATVETSCGTCAVGCRGALQSSSNRLVRFLGVDSEPVNHGWLCDKGRYGFEYVHSPDRVLDPQLLVDGERREVSWPDALDAAATALARVRDLHGPGAIALLGGARGSNEDAYAWARLAKGVLGTDHVDAQLGDGLPADVVLGVPRAQIADLDRAGAIVLLGPDPKEELPVLHLRIRRAALELGVPVIDLAPVDHGLTSIASAVLRPAPGEQGRLVERLVTAIDGTSSRDDAIDALAEQLRARPGPIVVFLGRGSLAESPAATVRAAAAFAGRDDTLFLSGLRRGNVHGALEVGLAPGFLPGRVTLADGAEWFTERWGTVPADRGLDATGVLRAAAEGRIHALVLVGADPLSDFPDRALVERALDGIGTIVAVDAFVSESTRRAEVFLPCTLWGEKAGSTTNLEGRVQRLGMKVSPEGTSMDEWRIAVELAARLGVDFDLETVDEVTDEIAAVAPALLGATADLLRRARDGVVVPVADHVDDVVLRRGALSILADDGSAVSWDPIRVEGEHLTDAEEAHTDDAASATAARAASTQDAPALYQWDRVVTGGEPAARDAYALRLVTSRTLYDAGRAVTSTPVLAGLPREQVVDVNPSDLTRLTIADGDEVRITSARGSLTVRVRASHLVPPGVARCCFTADGQGAARVIDAAGDVTDLRVETIP
ncbi:MAG TPA: molybdopterin-dependent oxidoreductase, partial [Acidimicrobiia bacterium]|nr:molybdopterin-dependent oxidoreductase [Acidimicrobiia bacterium]